MLKVLLVSVGMIADRCFQYSGECECEEKKGSRCHGSGGVQERGKCTLSTSATGVQANLCSLLHEYNANTYIRHNKIY